jgi:hypothetical protein
MKNLRNIIAVAISMSAALPSISYAQSDGNLSFAEPQSATAEDLIVVGISTARPNIAYTQADEKSSVNDTKWLQDASAPMPTIRRTEKFTASSEENLSSTAAEKDYSLAVFERMVADHRAQLINPGHGVVLNNGGGRSEDYDANLDRMNDPGPQRDDRVNPEDRDNDGGNVDRGGHKEAGGWTDNGHGRDPAPPKQDEILTSPEVIMHVKRDMTVTSGGTVIGG